MWGAKEKNAEMKRIVILSVGRKPEVEGSWQYNVVNVTCANRRWLLPSDYRCEAPSALLTLRMTNTYIRQLWIPRAELLSLSTKWKVCFYLQENKLWTRLRKYCVVYLRWIISI